MTTNEIKNALISAGYCPNNLNDLVSQYCEHEVFDDLNSENESEQDRLLNQAMFKADDIIKDGWDAQLEFLCEAHEFDLQGLLDWLSIEGSVAHDY